MAAESPELTTKEMAALRKLLYSLGDPNEEGLSIIEAAVATVERVDAHLSTVRNWIEDLRRQGWPIGSKNGYGYFLITSDDEFRAVMASMEERRASTAETMSALAGAFYGEGQRFYYGTGGGDGGD